MRESPTFYEIGTRVQDGSGKCLESLDIRYLNKIEIIKGLV